MNQFFTPTMIIENTQFGKVVSLPKGLERNSNTEDEKSNFDFKIFRALSFYTGKRNEHHFLKSKIDFSSSVWEFRSNPFRSKTTLPSCVFSIIIVGVKN